MTQYSTDELQKFIARINISGSEFIFVFLPYLVNLLLGTSLFVILVNFHAEYAKTIDKVKSACGFSLRLAISRICASVKDGNDGGR